MKTCIELFWDLVIKDPTCPFLIEIGDSGETRSYDREQTLTAAIKIAIYLKGKYSERTHIGILSKNSPEWIIMDLGIWLANMVSVPLYPAETEENIKKIIEDGDIAEVYIGILEKKFNIENIISSKTKIFYRVELLNIIKNYQANLNITSFINNRKDRLREDDLATIVYTSGSTGRAKGVMLSYKNITSTALNLIKTYNYNESDRMISYLPLSHVMERAGIEITGLINGHSIYFGSGLKNFKRDLQLCRPTLFISVPRLWQKFKEEVDKKITPNTQDKLFRIPIIGYLVKRKILWDLGLNKARYALTGSAALSENIVSWYKNLGLELLEAYGMTENFAYSHATKPGQGKIGYVGTKNLEVDDRFDPENQEIQIKSPSNTLGYYKNPEESAKLFTADGYLKTGDTGEKDSLGRLKITGRIKELFKTSKGKYIIPSKIENKILSINNDLIDMVLVSGENRPQPFAIIKLKNKTPISDGLIKELESIRKEINKILADHEKIDFFMVSTVDWTVENNMMTTTLKIKRKNIEAYHNLNQIDEDNRQPVIIFKDN